MKNLTEIKKLTLVKVYFTQRYWDEPVHVWTTNEKATGEQREICSVVGVLYNDFDKSKFENNFTENIDKSKLRFEYTTIYPEIIHKNLVLFIQTQIGKPEVNLFENYVSLTDWVWNYIYNTGREELLIDYDFVERENIKVCENTQHINNLNLNTVSFDF